MCSYGAFAFVTTFNPQAADDKPLSDAIQNITGIAPTVVEMAYFRRLHLEAHAMTVADARLRIEAPPNGEESTVRKMPAPERTERYNKQKTRLTGLVWSLTLEPSHRLIDKTQQQVEDNAPSYISLDQCTCRQQELAGIRKEPTVRIDPATGTMSVGEKQTEEWANTSSDHNLRMAFRRRALAYDQCNLVSYEQMEVWTERLFSAMLDIPPAGYSAPTRDRILAADRQLFAKVVETCRSGVIPANDETGIYNPIESAIKLYAEHPSVIFHLLPLPTLGLSSKRPADSNQEPNKRQRGNSGRRLKRDNNNQRDNVTNASSSSKPAEKDRSKGQGKDRGKGSKGKEAQLPPALQGCWRTVKGKKACIYFNMAICENRAGAGEECRQGIHLCMQPQCGENHPAVMCPKRINKKE